MTRWMPLQRRSDTALAAAGGRMQMPPLWLLGDLFFGRIQNILHTGCFTFHLLVYLILQHHPPGMLALVLLAAASGICVWLLTAAVRALFFPPKPVVLKYEPQQVIYCHFCCSV